MQQYPNHVTTYTLRSTQPHHAELNVLIQKTLNIAQIAAVDATNCVDPAFQTRFA